MERVAEHDRLNTQAGGCDLWHFEAAPRASQAGAEDKRISSLAEAADPYPGGLCQDADYQWPEPVREDLRCRVPDVIVALADCREGADNL
jgi:two-component SAPR family response regulator